jgi:hypothetical protein
VATFCGDDCDTTQLCFKDSVVDVGRRENRRMDRATAFSFFILVRTRGHSDFHGPAVDYSTAFAYAIVKSRRRLVKELNTQPAALVM